MGVHLNRGGVAVTVFFPRRILVKHHIFWAKFGIRLLGLIHGVHILGISITFIGVSEINRQP